MDILNAKCTVYGFTFRVIVVYLDTKEIERNIIIKRNIEQIIEGNQDMPITLLGDFNGHIGYIGEQKLDKNRNLVLDIVEKFGLVLYC